MTPGARPPAPPVGLCERCEHARRIDSAKGSTFWLCGRAASDPRYRKYPALPVVRCAGFGAAGDAGAAPGAARGSA